MSNNTFRAVTIGLLVALSSSAMAFMGTPSLSNALGDAAMNMLDWRLMPTPSWPGADVAAQRQLALDRQFCAARRLLDEEYACKRASLEVCIKSPLQLQSCLEALANAYQCQFGRLQDKYCQMKGQLAAIQ